MSTQQPTCTQLRIRSIRDANVVFHAVAMNILPIVSRRLDAADRAALRPGCVYVWEERAPASDESGVGMERFTEGRHWHPSRVRDDFLLYHEREPSTESTTDVGPSTSNHTLSHNPRLPQLQTRQRSQLIKQTYSVWVNRGGGIKKWHINAYYTEESVCYLRTINDIPALANLVVPHECYRRARSSRTKDQELLSSNVLPATGPTSQSDTIDNITHMQTPAVPLIHRTGNHLHMRNLSTEAQFAGQVGHSDMRNRQLVPLDLLQSQGMSRRRERVDDELLRSFKP
ncbi:hypothetical protein BD410DRAFT_742453 [Rickenella mellea]|uniref:Gti1/Pac2 family-domain-containing protein n=1 Tax=Rickenella mellea TaxID=50990 RepID=A0A4Y7QF50_9AGAM|nr:hypothetical protein BD410DRAFT_742453 [Rickenella mellea]